ncbi:DUF547 domain-containing protein [Aegicerativicinus sediminis]
MLYGLVFHLFAIVVLGCKEAPQPNYLLKEPKIITDEKVNHLVWDSLLKQFVDGNGFVDYKGFKNEEIRLNNYLQSLAKHPPQNNWTKDESIAYYINAYNAHTIKLILDNYPISSIKDIRNPWDQKRVQIGNNILSLGEIEHEVLRKMNEPRIHFAINCASFSCPKLRNEAFIAKKLEEQLEIACKDFINDSSKNKFQNLEAQLSKIFKWYKSDFTENVSLIEYINRYAYAKISNDAKIRFLEYDWSLNEKP